MNIRVCIILCLSIITSQSVAKPSLEIEKLSPRAKESFELKSYSIETNKTTHQIQIALPKIAFFKESNKKCEKSPKQECKALSLDKSKVFYTLDGGAFLPILLNLIVADSDFDGVKLPIIVALGHEGEVAFDRAARIRDYLPKSFGYDEATLELKATSTHANQANTINQKRANLSNELHNAAGEEYRAFLLKEVLPFVEGELKALLDTQKVRESMLFGHSFGGIFVLSALFHPNFTQKSGITHYVSASPSLWAGNIQNLLTKDMTSHLSQNSPKDKHRLTLLLTRGSLEEENCHILKQLPSIAKESSIAQKANTESRGKKDILIDCLVFENQSHGSVIPYALKAAMQRLISL